MENCIKTYLNSNIISTITDELRHKKSKILLNSAAASSFSLLIATESIKTKNNLNLIITESKEEAAYMTNDLEEWLQDNKEDYHTKKVLFYPALSYGTNTNESDNIALRLQVLNRLEKQENVLIVSYPEAIAGKVAKKETLTNKKIRIQKGERLDVDSLIENLDSYGFECVDFVVRSGEYALRGGIIDIFSYSEQMPCRIELNGDDIESLRSFDVATQLSLKEKEYLFIVPSLEEEKEDYSSSFFDYLNENTIIWTKNLPVSIEKIQEKDNIHIVSNSLLSKEEILEAIADYTVIETGISYFERNAKKIEYSTESQTSFNQNFSLFVSKLEDLTLQGYNNNILVRDEKQKERIKNILNEYGQKGKIIQVKYLDFPISSGFIDNENKLSFFTDHQLFDRYNRYRILDNSNKREQLTVDDLIKLKPGDFVTHMDYGVGKFSGLEKLVNNGKEQEAIRLIYKNNDILYVSIHSLHKISRYTSSEGSEPTLNRLGSKTWQALKDKTKKKVKDIAKDLIKLYAQRKASNGFAFSEDSYMQNELEASFIYEDTPDQYKATKDVKKDMEQTYPMDRLICADVGFGKTEVAIRAAFKAVADSKQVAVLVPTTILAFQHYKTFSERLKNMPCKVDYLNRFRSAKEKSQILKELKEGKIDILIGTHIIANKNTEFKDLGLLIIDEEQKFGVSVKEKIKQMKINIDTLTMTATPIPRTLQFSLMGARDLSIINTPPLNRQPINTQLVYSLNEQIIQSAIVEELNRGGQVFFVHNRVQSLGNMEVFLHKLVPKARIGVGHGQMDGKELEQVMMDFINEEYDILLSTTIVENGLDIPNANTIIINDAQNYGLSDLHQLRGRVGRSNKKAFCYLIIPGEHLLTEQAYKRLQAICEFSSIGSGFSIAMRDLDIRGAGNILGAEQSGFITDIGYDAYNKILSEAMEELKETEFKNLYGEKKNEYVKECTIETDLEVLIPDSYITNISERFKIYKELDSMSEEDELQKLSSELRDRFGKIPQQTLDLFDIVRIRKSAKEMAMEKVVLKRDKCTITFVRNRESEFYSSEKFQRILTFVNQFPQRCSLKEEGTESLLLIINNIKTISQAKKMFEYLMK